jgi:hypothetical protein
MNVYTFPYETCEVPKSAHLATQPYSVAMNLFICLYLVQFILICRHRCTRLLFLQFVVFETAHAFSHAYHFENTSMQFWIMHGLNYGNVLVTSIFLECMSDTRLSWTLAAFATIIDIIVVAMLPGVWPIISGLGVYFAIICDNVALIPTDFKRSFWTQMCPALLLIFILFINESWNCIAMLTYWQLPYHSLIELLGLFLFVCLSRQIVHWDNIYKKSI